jgi:acetylornithine/succinyldiaminopimelate/putrescine aminotransferase
MLPGFNYAAFGDLASVERAIDGETCAILFEPIQGEGGVNLPPAGFVEGVRNLCDTHGLLMILDEVQTGMGRTGKWFAHQHWAIQPDIVTLAKALAGGVAMGGLVAKPEVAEKLKPGTHAATFGGNPLAARAALATIETIEQEGLLDRAIQIGERFRQRFLELKENCPLIAAVRAKGAMIGVELNIEGAAVVQACLEKGLLINCTHQTVLRLLPALTLSDEQLEDGCDIIADVLLAMKP